MTEHQWLLLTTSQNVYITARVSAEAVSFETLRLRVDATEPRLGDVAEVHPMCEVTVELASDVSSDVALTGLTHSRPLHFDTRAFAIGCLTGSRASSSAIHLHSRSDSAQVDASVVINCEQTTDTSISYHCCCGGRAH